MYATPVNRAAIIAAVRTPIGRYGGSLSSVRPDDLAAQVIRAVVDRSGIDPSTIDDVYFGADNQSGEDNRNVARMASLLAGLPESVPGVTVNRLCASGLEAINIAARMIESGQGEVYLAGGGIDEPGPVCGSSRTLPLVGRKRCTTPRLAGGSCIPRWKRWGTPILWVSRPKRWPRSTASSRGPRPVCSAKPTTMGLGPGAWSVCRGVVPVWYQRKGDRSGGHR